MNAPAFDLDRLLDDARVDDGHAAPPAATLAVLKRRRLARTLLAGFAGASLLVCGYAIGAAGATAETPPTPVLAPTSDVVAPGPRELERRALAAGDPELFEAAGQAYLEENGDLPASLRCFGRAVAAGTEPPRSDDPWLLLALKTDRP